MAPRLHETEPREGQSADKGERRSGFSRFRTAAAAAALMLGACTYEGPGVNPIDGTGGHADTGMDAGEEIDAGHEADGGHGGQDAGQDSDGGSGGTDGGVLDAGSEGGVDAGHDADGGTDGGILDAGSDGGMGGDGGMDGGMDAGEGGMDGGVTDAGSDGGVDAGIVCNGVFADSRLGLWPLGTDIAVGGYNFRYTGQIGGGVQYDIRCVSGGAVLETNHAFTQGIEGTV
ncbi:MAG TPA: hypothetical protein VLD37_06920, partial [Candidatus Bilamarchaeum sp.]|nr:hypothetical protein [Candidatus Bilamarchaeum sp.]